MNREEIKFMTSVTEFFMQYLRIPSNWYDESGLLSKSNISACAKYLIDTVVFDNERDMKEEAIKSMGIILPQWVFDF